MKNQFARSEMLFGAEGLAALESAHVAVFGLGGVGSYAVEALVRSGIGQITIVDNDSVSLTNLNRQLYALHSTVGKNKIDVARERILDINPDCKVNGLNLFFLPEDSADGFVNASGIDFESFDFVVDCIDTVKAKLALIEFSKKAGVPVISCMGTGNKIHPELLEISDISKTCVCPLARVIRQELKKRHICDVPVVFSKEIPVKPVVHSGVVSGESGYAAGEDCGEVQPVVEMKGNSVAPGSCAFVPSAAGLLIASYVVQMLL